MSSEPYSFPSFTKTFHHEAYEAISPSREALSTKGKSVVITGAGSGIGAGIALAFAKSGASHLALVGRTEETLQKTKANINQAYPNTRVYVYAADLVESASLDAAFGSFASAVGGKIDIIVSNAAFMPEVASIALSDEDDWWSGIDVNVKGQYNLIRAFLPLVADDAAVINVASCVAHLPYVPGTSSYHISKLGAVKLFDYVQAEYPGLTVIQFHPGVVYTAMSKKSFDAGIPMGQLDEVDLPGSFAVWCASPEARFLRGKFLWANWDVEELKTRGEEIERSNKLTMGLLGWE